MIANPNAFLQSLNTKGDLVVGLWLCSAAWWAVRPWAGRPWNLTHAGLFGASLGLLALTKGTGYLFAVPVALVAGLGLAVQQRASVWRSAILAGCLFVLLNLGHWVRNQEAYHAVLGPSRWFGTSIGNETHQPGAIASNVIRNLALQLGTPSPRVNAVLTEGIATVHGWLGIDMNDLRTTLMPEYCGFFRVVEPMAHEDTAPAPLHVVLLLALLLGLPFGWRRLDRAAWMFLLIPCACFVLFCTAIKWWPWHARLHAPSWACSAWSWPGRVPAGLAAS